MIAMLSNSTRIAVDTLRDRIATMDNGQRGTLKDGRSFKIITRETQLEGLQLSGYEVLGEVTERLIDVTKARIR